MADVCTPSENAALISWISPNGFHHRNMARNAIKAEQKECLKTEMADIELLNSGSLYFKSIWLLLFDEALL